VTGAAGGVGVRVATPYCWLERVRSDGSLETPGGYRLVDSSPGYVGTPTGPRGEESRLVEWCKFSPAVAAPGATP
jgi:hypothetical protein